MKITRDTTDVLELVQGNVSGLIVGAILLLAGPALVVATWVLKSPYLWIAGLVVIGIGALVLLLHRRITLRLDKGSRGLVILRQGLIGQAKTEPIEFARVKEVIIEETRRTTGSGDQQREQSSYQLIFHLTDGQMEAIDVTPAVSASVNVLGEGRFRQGNALMVLGNKIAAFIGVPFSDRRPPTFGQVVDGIRSVLSGTPPAGEKPRK